MPLNIGVFLIVLASVMMVGFIAGIILKVIPLVFTIYGIWLIVASFFFSPTGSYAPPRIMILGWGALIMALGLIWFVGVFSLELVPIIFAVLVLVAGIGIVGYSFMKAENKKPGSTSPTPSTS
jgi:hypothetical protein